MIKKVLIAGGTGFIGHGLAKIFRGNNYSVSILTRHPSGENEFSWNDEGVFENTDSVIHLAGANIGTKRWTEKRKKEILESRVKSTELLFEKLKSIPNNVKVFISSSAVGYYGDTGNNWVNENNNAGKDFLAAVCKQWEEAVRKIESLGIRVVILRTGVVLDKKEGALPIMAMPVKYFVATPVGNGRQYISWIHIDDICQIYKKVIEDETINGIFNAVASNPVTNKEFTKALTKELHRPFWNFPVPAFLLKLFLGEKAEIVIKGQRVSNQKIIQTGFQFQYDDIESALKNIYKN